jgi:hypothetical protein
MDGTSSDSRSQCDPRIGDGMSEDAAQVERVARAIWGEDDLSLDDTWEECACKDMVRAQARAAIAAMPEPGIPIHATTEGATETFERGGKL